MPINSITKEERMKIGKPLSTHIYCLLCDGRVRMQMWSNLGRQLASMSMEGMYSSNAHFGPGTSDGVFQTC